MSSISLPAALWLAAGVTSAVWLVAGWRWLARLLHMLQGGGYYQRYFFRWLLQAGRHHQIIFTAALLLPLLTVGLRDSAVAGLVAAAWACHLGTRGSALAAPVPGTPGQASAPLDEEGAGVGNTGLPPDPAGGGGTLGRRPPGGWRERRGSGLEPGPWCRPGHAPGAAVGGDAHRVAGAGGGSGTALAGGRGANCGQATLASSGSPAATVRPVPRSS